MRRALLTLTIVLLPLVAQAAPIAYYAYKPVQHRGAQLYVDIAADRGAAPDLSRDPIASVYHFSGFPSELAIKGHAAGRSAPRFRVSTDDFALQVWHDGSFAYQWWAETADWRFLLDFQTFGSRVMTYTDLHTGEAVSTYVNQAPEPSLLTLFGLSGMAVWIRRRRSTQFSAAADLTCSAFESSVPGKSVKRMNPMRATHASLGTRKPGN